VPALRALLGPAGSACGRVRLPVSSGAFDAGLTGASLYDLYDASRTHAVAASAPCARERV